MESIRCDADRQGREGEEGRAQVVVVRAFEPGWSSRQSLWNSYEAVIPIISRSAKALEPSRPPANLEGRLEVEGA